VRFEPVVEDGVEDGDDEEWVETEDAWAETDDEG
jgi:hypothetical protein